MWSYRCFNNWNVCESYVVCCALCKQCKKWTMWINWWECECMCAYSFHFVWFFFSFEFLKMRFVSAQDIFYSTATMIKWFKIDNVKKTIFRSILSFVYSTMHDFSRLNMKAIFSHFINRSGFVLFKIASFAIIRKSVNLAWLELTITKTVSTFIAFILMWLELKFTIYKYCHAAIWSPFIYSIARFAF